MKKSMGQKVWGGYVRQWSLKDAKDLFPDFNNEMLEKIANSNEWVYSKVKNVAKRELAKRNKGGE